MTKPRKPKVRARLVLIDARGCMTRASRKALFDALAAVLQWPPKRKGRRRA